MVRGRKRKAGRRHPSGKLVQPSGAETQREAMATALEARQRHYGVTARQAKDDRLGTALGRLAFAGTVTAEQFAAGELYGDTGSCGSCATRCLRLPRCEPPSSPPSGCA